MVQGSVDIGIFKIPGDDSNVWPKMRTICLTGSKEIASLVGAVTRAGSSHLHFEIGLCFCLHLSTIKKEVPPESKGTAEC